MRKRRAIRRSDFGKRVNQRLKKKAPRKHNHKKLIFQNKQYRYEQAIPKSHLRPGMVVSFRYRGIMVHDPTPLVLVLNQEWAGKLHGINLNYCNYAQIIKIAAMVNKKINARAIKLGEKYKMTSPRGFYHIHLKPILQRMSKSIYRTYFVRGISQTKLMDYKFSATQGKNSLVFNTKDGVLQTKVTKIQPEQAKKVRKKPRKDQVKVVSLNTKSRQKAPIESAVKQNDLTVKKAKRRAVRNVKTIPNSITPAIKKD